jgi:hypothetical protein
MLFWKLNTSTYAMDIETDNAAINSLVDIDGSVITPNTYIDGPIRRFTQTHQVSDKSGKKAQVYVNVVNAPLGLDYRSKVLPSEGNLRTIEPWVSAEEWLTVPKADSLKCTATTSYGRTLSADVGIELAKGRQRREFVTLTDYYDKAYASASQVEASQTATDGSGNSINIYGHAKDASGSYSIDTPIASISGLTACFQDLDALSGAGTTTQVTQKEHAIGKFSSKAVAGKKTKTRTSNYGIEYDLNMQAIKGSAPTGILGYYVNPSMATTCLGAIQGAVNAAKSGDTINAAAGTYNEDVNINKDLTLKGTGDPTADSFTLNAIFGTGSGGITAPIIYVNPTAKIQDGVTFASFGGTVNVAAGTYKENVMIDKSLTLNGASAGSTIVDGNKAGSVFTIGSSADVTLSDMTVMNGDALVGGGVNNAGRLNLKDVVVSGNNARGDIGGGGAIYNNGILTVTGSTISGNTAYGIDFTPRGGGIFNDASGMLTVDNSEIYENIAGDAGGIYNAGMLTISDSKIYNNFAESGTGGGILNNGISLDPSAVTLSVENCDIYGNFAYDVGGGIDNWGKAEIVNSRVFLNGHRVFDDGFELFTSNGGGIINAGSMDIRGSEVYENVAGYMGGGIANDGDAATINLIDSSVYSNTAYFAGGGIVNGIWATGTLNMVIGSYIADNTAGYTGGGIYNIGTVKFLDSIGNPVATWPGYDTTTDIYGFFKTHNNPDDIFQA